jgi:hypothetical protein
MIWLYKIRCIAGLLAVQSRHYVYGHQARIGRRMLRVGDRRLLH